MERELVKVDRNGTKYFRDRVRCDRCCNSSGVYRWGAIQTDWNGNVIGSTFAGVCFKCGGKGYVWDIVKEYTPEYRAKLDAANAKRKAAKQAKWEAERAEREKALAEQRAKEAAERAEREKARLEEIRRNRGHFIGEVGDKIQMDVTFDHEFTYEVPHPVCDWKTQTMTGYVFKTDDGCTLVWKTSGSIARKIELPWDAPRYCGTDSDKHVKWDWESPNEGDRIKIKGTIKAHEEYNNVNQTILTRVKWVR